MKNENKQRGDTGRTGQNPTRTGEQKNTPENRQQPGRTPVRDDADTEKRQDRQQEQQDDRHKETDPATAPNKTRETPKGNNPKA